MYTLYLDESGDWGYPNFSPRKPILCMCGCIVDEEYYYKNVIPTIKGLKRKTFRKDVVFHRYKICQRMGDFSILKSETNVEAFIRKFSQYIAESDIQLLISAINKTDYYSTYGQRRIDDYLPKDIYSIIITFIIERFVLFLKQHKSDGKIIAESRGKKEDQTIQYWYSLLLHNGTRFIHGWQFRDVLPNAIEFRKKSENIEGLQISDWIASPISKIIEYPDMSKDTHGEWELYKEKIWLGKNAPARGQVGFKVFPKNLGRKLLNMPLKSEKDSN
ncbi:MAG: DUF3800 domain-containing protein [Dehalococcoidales bacterium]|nr:DUF3800 domain-containing protein [Dehalococcoidales bacterium]